MKIYSAYDRPPQVVLDCGGAGKDGVSMARQSMKDEADINTIVKRYMETGFSEYVNTKSPVYMNVSDMGDYGAALAQVREAERFFSGLPARIRKRFKNDAGEFLDFMSDPANEVEGRKLGLARAVPPEKVAPVDEVPGPGIQARGADGRFESPK